MKQKSYDTGGKNIQLFSGIDYTLGKMHWTKEKEIGLYLIKVNTNDKKYFVCCFPSHFIIIPLLAQGQ